MKTAFEQMMNGLDEVETFLAGSEKGFKVHVPDEVDVKRIRAALKMTQSRFSNIFGFSLDAIKHWEGGRRKPESSARVLLTVIEKNPEAVLTALHPQTVRAIAMKRSGKTFKAKKARGYAAGAGRGRSAHSHPQNS